MREMFCNNVGCFSRGMRIKTDKKKCLMCEKPLTETFESQLMNGII